MKPRLPPSRDLLLLFSIAFLTHLGLWTYTYNVPEARNTIDSVEYTRSATNFLENGTIYSGRMDRRLEPSLFSRRPPLYPLLLAALRPISKDAGLITLAQILLNFLGAYMLWEILRRLLVTRYLRILVVAAYLFYPTQLIYTHLIMAEVLLQLTLLSALFFLVRFQQSKNWSDLSLFNLMLALSALTKPLMVYFWLPSLVYQAWLLWRLKKSRLIFLALIPLLFVTVWSYRNYLHTSYFHFSSIKTSNMLHVNIRGLVRRSEGKERARIVARELEKEADNAGSFAEANRAVERAFFETMLKNWKSLIPVYLRGSLFFFLDPGRYDLYEFLNLPHDVRSFQFLRGGIRDAIQKLGGVPPYVPPYFVLVGSINLVLLVGFIYTAFSRRYPSEIRFFVLTLMAYVLLIVAQTGLSRFRLSLMPFLFLSLPPLLEALFNIPQAKGNLEQHEQQTGQL
jgi:hypothetical protein